MKTISNIGLVFFIGLMTICCLPNSVNAQQLPLLSADSDDNSGGRTILLGLSAGTSKKPSIQFSENANAYGLTDGMSIEYDGTGSAATNKLNINSTTNSPIFTLLNNGDASNTGKFSTNSLEVALGATINGNTQTETLTTSDAAVIGGYLLANNQLDVNGGLSVLSGDTRLTNDTNGSGATARTAYLPGHIYIAPFNNTTNISYLQARREDNSGDTQLNIRTWDNGSLTESMQIKKDGDVDILGYTELGSGSPAIKIKKLTGLTNGSQGGIATIAHGLDGSKIISVNVNVISDSGFYFPPNATSSVGGEYVVLWDLTNIFIGNTNTNSSTILNNEFTVTILYEK